MMAPLDVFSIRNDEPFWLGAAESLVDALTMASKAGSGRYFVFSHQTGQKTLYEVDARGTVRPVQASQQQPDN